MAMKPFTPNQTFRNFVNTGSASTRNGTSYDYSANDNVPFMQRRFQLQDTSSQRASRMESPAGLPSLNILDEKYGMQMQQRRGFRNTDPSRFMRNATANKGHHTRHNSMASKSMIETAGKWTSSASKRPKPLLQSQGADGGNGNGADGADQNQSDPNATGVAKSSDARPKAFSSSLLNYKPKQGVSAIVKTQNAQIYETYRSVNDPRANNVAKARQNFASMAQEQSLKFRKAAKTLKAELKMMVKSADNSHYILEDRRPQEFEVIEDVGVLLKLHLKELKPPCTISFKTASKIQKLKVFHSSDIKEPTEYHNHGNEDNPKKIQLTGVRSTLGGGGAAQRQNVFNKEWLYMNLQSETGCIVTVNVTSKSDTAMMIKSPTKTITGFDATAVSGGFTAAVNAQNLQSARNQTFANTQNSVQAATNLQKSTMTVSSQDPNSDDFDFRQWSLGNGKVKDKRAKLENLLGQLIDRKNTKLKKDLDFYCKQIKQKRNRVMLLQPKDVQEVSLIKDHMQGSDNEGHTCMITQMRSGDFDGVNEQDEYEYDVNNDFIGKNKNMLAFYRDHEQEKREAFSKLNEFLSVRAKYNRQVFLENKRNNAINYFIKLDERPMRKEKVIEGLMRAKRSKISCGVWLTLAAFFQRMQVIEQHLVVEREKLAALAREEARKRKLAEELAKVQTEKSEKEAEEQEAPETAAAQNEAAGQPAAASAKVVTKQLSAKSSVNGESVENDKSHADDNAKPGSSNDVGASGAQNQQQANTQEQTATMIKVEQLGSSDDGQGNMIEQTVEVEYVE